MLWRYIGRTFFCWFGALFAAVGLIIFVPTVNQTIRSGGPHAIPTAVLATLGAAFFAPGAVLFVVYFRHCLRSVTALQRGQYVVGRVEHIVPANEWVNGRSLYRVAWSWAGSDGKRRHGKSPSLERSDAMHWKRGDEIAAYIHPSDPEFAEADVFGLRAR
jgi:uncharacterized protein DUF3592